MDVVKIDRSFVATIQADGAGSALAEGIVGLARTLGVRTVAEGVETAHQADVLRSLGCEMAQGWFFGRPKPAKEIERMLREQLTAKRAPADLTAAHLGNTPSHRPPTAGAAAAVDGVRHPGE